MVPFPLSVDIFLARSPVSYPNSRGDVDGKEERSSEHGNEFSTRSFAPVNARTAASGWTHTELALSRQCSS